MAANYWAKIWIEMLDDRKVASLPDSQYRRFVECILIAKEYNQDGLLPPVDDMAWRLRPLTPDQLNNDLSHLAKNGLTELVATDDGERWFLPKFADRQRASTSTERSDLHRKYKDVQRYSDDGATILQRNVAQSRSRVEAEKKQKRAEAEAEAENNGASADLAAAAAYLKQFGIAYNETTAPIAEMDADYIIGHMAEVHKGRASKGLAITRMLDGDAVPRDPNERVFEIPAEYADVVQR